MTAATAIAVVIFILASTPEMKTKPTTCSNPVCNNTSLCPNIMICEPKPPNYFETIELVCLYIFLIDYLIRIILCSTVPSRVANVVPHHWDKQKTLVGKDIHNEILETRPDPVYSWYHQEIKYLFLFPNLIDALSIIPFFLLLANDSLSTLTALRILNIQRIFRIIKLGKRSKGITILAATARYSFKALLILGFFLLIGLIFFGSIVFFFEQGNYTVNSSYPNGAYLRQSIDQTHNEVSPYTSILDSMYWAATTTTTVGYGDIVPTSIPGRFFAVLAIYCGVFVFALPIAVIGNAFTIAHNRASNQYAQTVSRCLIELSRKIHDDHFNTSNHKNQEDLIVQVTAEKAKKLSAILILSKVYCNNHQQRKIIKLVDDLGLSKALESYRNKIEKEAIRRTFIGRTGQEISDDNELLDESEDNSKYDNNEYDVKEFLDKTDSINEKPKREILVQKISTMTSRINELLKEMEPKNE